MQKKAVWKKLVQICKFEEECRQFWAWIFVVPEALEKQGQNICGKISQWKFAEKNLPTIFLKFAGPKSKMTPDLLCRTLGSRFLGDYSGNPNPYNVSEKYWRYTSNLYRSTSPICNAVPRWLLSFGERETPQYTSNLYCSTPPICTAVRLAFVPAIPLRKYQGWGFRNLDGPAESGRFARIDSQKTPIFKILRIEWFARIA